MEKDLKVIAAKAETNWTDNWNFRSFLQHHVDPDIIDETVKLLNKVVSSQIECTDCGNCCRELQPHLDEVDVIKIASELELDISQTKTRFLLRAPDRSYRFAAKPCPMLKDNRCSIYKSRPVDCAEYPHLDKVDFLAGSIGIIENYRVCPIVFNVYELLKKKFNYDGSIDYVGDADPETYSGSYFIKP